MSFICDLASSSHFLFNLTFYFHANIYLKVLLLIVHLGYDFQNIENGKGYKLILYVKSLDSVDIDVSVTNSDGSQTLATTNIA